jgi:Lysozyme like domain
MALSGVSIGGVALMGGGLLFLWSGFHGASITGSLRDLLQGKQPPGSNTNPIGGTAAGSVAAGGAGGPVLGAYSHAQIEQLWTGNGGDPSRANLAAAIAQAESSGNPKVTSSNPDGGTNVGLWQLDTKGKGAGYTVAQLQDPNTNARVTIMGSANGTDWSAWATYGSGAYQRFMGAS